LSGSSHSLGGSGSGKTSLLHAMRASPTSSLPIESGKVVGLDCGPESELGDGAGRSLEDREYRKRIGFVRQQDFLVEHLTGKFSVAV
jgi:ABC-type phosphate/phosphonate transport system ATPase subunit